MELCADCQDLTKAFAEPGTHREIRWNAEKTLQLSREDMSCQLCKVFHAHVLRPPDTICIQCQDFHVNLVSPPLISIDLLLEVYQRRDGDGGAEDKYFECIIHYKDKGDAGHLMSGHMSLEVWADEGNVLDTRYLIGTRSLISMKGTPASATFVTQPPLFTHSLKDVSRLAQSWLENCQSLHTHCPAVEETALPSRLLSVSGDDEIPTVRLVETGGTVGRYCALSHCWGAEHKRPLRTKRDNYQQHLEDIGFERLPATFQHTVLLIRSIGIRFVWIDSLCIVQDDCQDWEDEAKEMGKIYRNAAFVIAAAGSRDSTEGLFNQELTQPAIVSAPYISNDIAKGYYNIAAQSQYPRELLYEAPLLERAWCFQELYLAQKVVTFMPGAVSWTCNQGCLTERGTEEDASTISSGSWFEVLKAYTRRLLTFPSDRLHALKGVASEMQKTRQDSFLFEYGIWEDQIYEQLLWRRTRPHQEEDSLHLPSWCWAGTGGAKVWWYDDWVEIHEGMPRTFTIDDSGSINVLGHVTKAGIVISLLPQEVEEEIRGRFPEETLLPGWSSDDDSVPPYLLTNRSHGNMILGIGVFDGNPVFQASFLFLVSVARGARTP